MSVTVERTDARELLVDLVSIPSPTGEETECAERLASFFEEHDREVWIDDAGNVRAPADDSVLLTSHVDTVPGDIPVRVEEGPLPGDDEDEESDDGESDAGAEPETGELLWGRGSVDAKGPLASMAVAAVETGVSFVGVVGEETDSRGARHLIEDRESEPGAVINGEPSGWDGVTLGYRGFLAGTYVATSESGHTSRPEANAIQDAIAWWNRVEEAFEADDWTPVFERVTTKPVGFDGGTAPDGLSVEATLDAQFRVPPETTAEEIREIADGELDVGTVHWKEPIPSVMENPRTEVARQFRVAIREEGGDPRLLRKTGTSDMNLYAEAWDCPMATYGPGDSSLDHTPNERLALADFENAIAVLRRVANGLGGDGE